MKILKKLIESLSSHQRDFTSGPIGDAVILLSIPMILELSLESLFAVVDMFFVSRLGAVAIATVGLTEALIMLVYSIAMGVSVSATAMVARSWGEKNFSQANLNAGQSIWLGLLVSLIFAIIGGLFPKELLGLMGASVEVVQEGEMFARIMFLSSPIIVLLFLINGIFRGAGDANMSMRSVWIASGANILLCPLMITWLGLPGAAVATLMGRSLGVTYQLFHLIRGRQGILLKWADFLPRWNLQINLIKIAWPATLQFLIGTGSWILLTRIVAEFGGTEATAGYQIAFRNFIFFILPAWGISNAAATLVGQSLGAQKPERAEQAVYVTLKWSALFMGVVTLGVWWGVEWIVSQYTRELIVAQHGVHALKVLGLGFVIYGVGMVLTQALNGAGDTKTPTWLNFICLWMVQIPLAFGLSQFTDLGVQGVIWSVPLAHLLMVIMAFQIFRRGRWKMVSLN